MSNLSPENETETTGMTLETAMLVEILGSVDSLFGEFPDSRAHNKVCFAIGERQRAYVEGLGIPWRVGGDAAARKAGERALGNLTTDGLVTIHKPARSHRHVGLTPLGDDHARGLLGFYRTRDSWPVFRGVAEAVERGPGRYATVADLADALGDVRATAVWGEIRPLLAAGLLESWESTVAEAVFTVHRDQQKVAAGDPPELLADPERDERANETYWLLFDRTEAEKLTWKPSRSNVCFVAVLN